MHCLWEPSMECCLRIIGPSVVCSHVVPTPPIIILIPWPNGEFRQVLGDYENKMYSSVYQRQTRIWGQKKDSYCYLKLKGAFKSYVWVSTELDLTEVNT